MQTGVIIEFSYNGYDQQGQIRSYSIRRNAGYSVTRKRKVNLGGNVKVHYNPSKPKEFYVKGSSGLGCILLMIFSLFTAMSR